MKVWIFQTGEPLHCDGGSPRPMRAMNLADSFVEIGDEVTIISSQFYHQKKMHRENPEKEIKISDKLTISLIKSPGYARNLSLRRLYDHLILAYNVRLFVKRKKENLPDVLFIGYPPIETAYYLCRFFKKKRIPVVIDVKDQWPIIFLNAFPSFLRGVANLILFPYFFIAKRAMKSSTAICSISKSFLDWSRAFSAKKDSSADFVFPLTSPLESCKEHEIAEAKQWWSNCNIDISDRYHLSFVGSLSRAFDFSFLDSLCSYLKTESPRTSIIIAGDGAQKEELAQLSLRHDNLFLPGWVDYPQIKVLYDCSMAALAPYRTTEDFNMSIPNKVIDYLASGLPVISSLHGEFKSLNAQYNIGYTYSSFPDLKNAIHSLINDHESRELKRINSVSLYKSKFEFSKIYSEAVHKIKGFVKNDQ